ncbi:MAG: hypothetical protein ACIAQF_08795 [Phycisphaerales bacterium JB065]
MSEYTVEFSPYPVPIENDFYQLPAQAQAEILSAWTAECETLFAPITADDSDPPSQYGNTVHRFLIQVQTGQTWKDALTSAINWCKTQSTAFPFLTDSDTDPANQIWRSRPTGGHEGKGPIAEPGGGLLQITVNVGGVNRTAAIYTNISVVRVKPV